MRRDIYIDDESDRDVMDNLEQSCRDGGAIRHAGKVKLWRNAAPTPAEFADAAARVADVDDESWCPRLA